MRLIDADKLREQIGNACGDCTYAWNQALEHAIALLDAAPTVEKPVAGMTVPEIQAALDRGEVVECQYSLDGSWVAVRDYARAWPNPGVRRLNVRVRPAPPATEQVPLTKLVGRVLVGETEPVSGYFVNAEWWAEGAHARPLPADVETGMVTVLAVKP